MLGRGRRCGSVALSCYSTTSVVAVVVGAVFVAVFFPSRERARDKVGVRREDGRPPRHATLTVRHNQ
jgi:hypothetical protein